MDNQQNCDKINIANLGTARLNKCIVLMQAAAWVF